MPLIIAKVVIVFGLRSNDLIRMIQFKTELIGLCILGAYEEFVVFNADGIYLATYVTLLLNFELSRRGYYPSCHGFVSLSEVRSKISAVPTFSN